MISATKFLVSEEKIKVIFEKSGLGAVSVVTEMTSGEFNAIYCVTANGKDYVIKIAPNKKSNVLTYEKSMMEQEVMFYNLLRRSTNILVPEIYYSDFSEKIIPAQYFIMEKVRGAVLNKVKRSRDENAKIQEMIAEVLANLHKVQGEKFGYVQNGLEDNWHLAIKKMVENLGKDCDKKGKSFKKGKTLLGYIEKHQNILKKVDSCCVNFDLHEGNLFYNKVDGEIQLTLIDPERSFFGDRISDFVNTDIMKFALESKTTAISNYNKYSETKITPTSEEVIRFSIMACYVALIMYTEKFYRYKVYNFGYIRNILAANLFWNTGIKGLKNNDKLV